MGDFGYFVAFCLKVIIVCTLTYFLLFLGYFVTVIAFKLITCDNLLLFINYFYTLSLKFLYFSISAIIYECFLGCEVFDEDIDDI